MPLLRLEAAHDDREWRISRDAELGADRLATGRLVEAL